MTAESSGGNLAPRTAGVDTATAAGDSRVVAWVFVAVFFFVLNGLGHLYWTSAGAGLKVVAVPLAIIVFWKLLEAECRPYRVSFPLDMGYFLYVTNFLALPYYLWRTQRWGGMVKLLYIGGLWAGTFGLWAVFAWLLSAE